MGFNLEIENIKIRVLKQNNFTNNTTIIFLHDSLGCIDLWRDFPQKLAEATQCNILIYDRQGYGKSDPFTSMNREHNYMELEADFLYKLMDKMEITKAILFGHSDGGTIALLTASKYPEKILGIITEGAHIFVEDITLAGIREAVISYEKTNLKSRLEKYHGEKTDSVFKAWSQTWLKESFSNWNIERFLHNITCPCLIIQGEHDEFGSLKQVEGIHNQVSGFSKKLVVSNAGHTPHKEAQEKTIAEVSDFIKNQILKN